jgi:predicted RNA binding protein YcfA (HicA-like mRNA interferase family)
MFFENLEEFKHLRTTGSHQKYKYIYKGNTTLISVYVSPKYVTDIVTKVRAANRGLVV